MHQLGMMTGSLSLGLSTVGGHQVHLKDHWRVLSKKKKKSNRNIIKSEMTAFSPVYRALLGSIHEIHLLQ